MRLTSSIVTAAAVLLAGLAGFAGREAWAQAAPTPAPTPDQLMATAQQQLRAGDRAGAIASLRSAVALDPKHGSAGLLITTLHQAGRIEEAYALGERYHREGPRNPRALFRFGWLLAFIGEVDRAEPLFRDLIALDKGGIYEARGNGELAYLARAHDGRGGRCAGGGAAARSGARRQPGGGGLRRHAGAARARLGAALVGR